MMTLLIITVVFFILYLFYPLWLKSLPNSIYSEEEKGEPEGVSIVYLSNNSESTIGQKIGFLLNEMDDLPQSELLVIDDGSKDSSMEILNGIKDCRLRIISKKEHNGIAHSMNLGVEMSKFEYIIFCDQRQKLSEGIIKKLIIPLQYSEIGAVSSCISNYDKTNRYSVLRAHENFIKKEEGKTGNLMGVYGPLYALKKKYYKPIPEYIILDDLYLSLNILSSKKIVFLNECQIYDEGIDILYTYKRTKQYVTGFVQILKDRALLAGLSRKQIIMILWHKYLRIVLPLLILLCYIVFAAHALNNSYLMLFFSAMTITIILILVSSRGKNRSQIGSICRIITFYSFALIEILILSLLKKNVNE